MGYQSAALAYNFGLNYEFGKRVIKSMSNEKFNKIADDPILLNELTSRHHDVLLKAFINEVPKVDKIQDLIIKKMVELEFAKIKVMPELIAQIPKGFIEGLFKLGETGETQVPPKVTSGGQGGKSEKETDTIPKPSAKKLQDFSRIPISTQKQIVSHMQKISANDKAWKLHPIKALRNNVQSNASAWRNLYRKVGGYINPDPYDAMPWLHPTHRAYMRDWQRLV